DVTSRWPDLAMSVRILTVSVKFPDGRMDLPKAVSLIVACPLLRELVWHYDPNINEPPTSRQANTTLLQRLAGLTSVRALRVYAVNVTFVRALLELCPSVAYLDIDVFSLSEHPVDLPALDLRHLLIDHNPSHWSSDIAAGRIRNRDVRSLERMSCDSGLSERHVLRFISQAYATLRSVTLQVWTEHLSAALRECPSLMQLVLWKPEQIQLRTTSLLSSLPKCIRHLVLYVNGSCDLFRFEKADEEQAALACIKDHLPALERFTTYPTPPFRLYDPFHSDLRWSLWLWEQACITGCRRCGVDVERRDRAERDYYVPLMPLSSDTLPGAERPSVMYGRMNNELCK
ncbi:hypothetical protein EXIGLDRAFT_716604, partial [Exidia glandulosa HHB12029]